MNIDEVEKKALFQANVSETLDLIQKQCNVDRDTARRFLEFEAGLTSVRMNQIIQSGAESGSFGLLKTVVDIMNGAKTAIHILKTDETL